MSPAGGTPPDPATTGARGTVGIVGLGLMGGSLARDLAALGWTVRGTDRDPETVERASAEGVISGPIDPGSLDVLVLAVPVRASPGWLRELGPQLHGDAVITDVGSTKRTVEEAAGAAGLGARFVGSHPVTGDHRSGWDASRRGLYRYADVWLCPAPEAHGDAVGRVEALWQSVGAEPRRIGAGDHRGVEEPEVGEVVASALGSALARLGVLRGDLGPGGRDTTRLAGSDPSVWVDILVDNSDEVAEALGEVVRELSAFERDIRGLDGAGLEARLSSARAWSRGRREPDTAVAGVNGI